MSAASLNQQEIKALEQTRQRLNQLNNSLASLQQNIIQSDPLPPWSSLQSLATIISQNLATVSQQLTTHHELFASMAVYPLPEFPGKAQENLLGLLLRKKLEPNVEDWVAEGRDIATKAFDRGIPSSLQEEDMSDLWSWAGMAANEQARKHTWGGDYTLEEKEMGVQNVVTGLRRKLKESPDDSSDEDEEDLDDGVGDEMEIEGAPRKNSGVELDVNLTATGPAMPINDVFRFLMTGGASGR